MFETDEVIDPQTGVATHRYRWALNEQPLGTLFTEETEDPQWAPIIQDDGIYEIAVASLDQAGNASAYSPLFQLTLEQDEETAQPRVTVTRLTPVAVPGARFAGATHLSIIRPASIESEEAFGVPILRLTLRATLASIPSEEAFGVPTIFQAITDTFFPVSIPSEETFGVPLFLVAPRVGTGALLDFRVYVTPSLDARVLIGPSLALEVTVDVR